ncbi:spore coat protein [Caldibacillus lycopersici]|uniref:Spore coat protein n=1 Tax=Perspicuibacillus lycopersici TaxID=1325689 RepID=A0AAE3LPK8_9BACI|nr:spore coat protein [Perspicuibacillus lycopersici]MCU9615057.1 spore coat protein [Perspicuibacillus lycopersici]
METDSLAFHESMDTHEILNFKTVCLLKSKLMQGVVFDQELKALMEKDVNQSIQAIKELQDVYLKARLQ